MRDWFSSMIGRGLINCEGPSNHVSSSSFYLNQLWEVDFSGHLGNTNIRVLNSVLEGSEVSENWNLVLSKIQENTSSRNQEQVKQQLKVQLLLLAH